MVLLCIDHLQASRPNVPNCRREAKAMLAGIEPASSMLEWTVWTTLALKQSCADSRLHEQRGSPGAVFGCSQCVRRHGTACSKVVPSRIFRNAEEGSSLMPKNRIIKKEGFLSS